MSDREIKPATARLSSPLKGHARMPGDRAMAHRALILGGLAAGETRISGLPETDDVFRTAAAMRAFGATVETGQGEWRIAGVGNGCLLEPGQPLDFGGAMDAAQLVMGLAGPYDMRVEITGDPALQRRSLGRMLDPLRLMGVQVQGAAGDRLPMALHGPKVAAPISYRVPLASSLVKSIVLLAGLDVPGVTTVIESAPTPDHMERMLRLFGAALDVETDPGGLRQIRLEGQGRLTGQPVSIPGDPACAAALIVAALLVPGSDIVIEGLLVNPTRAGLLTTLREMGASIDIANRRVVSGEEVADLRVRHSGLRGVAVPASRAPTMAEEIPALVVAAAFADGDTTIEGLEDLRGGDRLAAMVAGLAANGVPFEEASDGLLVRGAPGGSVAGGGTVETRGDAQVAMAFLAMGTASARPVEVDDVAPVRAHFPGFAELFGGLGAAIE